MFINLRSSRIKTLTFSIFFSLAILPCLCSSKKILVVEFLGTKSHVLTYLPLVEELSRRGHEVTLVTPLKNMAKAGVREITTLDFAHLSKSLNLNIFEMKEKNEDLNPFTLLTDFAPAGCRELYDRADIQKLMTEEFDLVILQPMFNDCALGFIHFIMQKNNAPLILFTPTSAPSFIVGYIGGHHPPSFVPGVFTGFRDEMTLWERIQNLVAEIFVYTMYNFYYLPVMEAVYYEKVGSDLPNARQIFSSASLILSNGHFSISKPKPNLPNVIDVGGLHSLPAKPLPKDLEDFVSQGKHGFIYVSFGTGIRTDDMPPEKLEMFLRVFSKLKQQIVWKFETSKTTKLPKNVRSFKWLPQQDLLGHAQIKLFVTHCGLGGMEESIYHGVPLVGVPFYGDQPLNCKEAANHGYLVPLDWNTLTEEIFQNAIVEVLENPTYRDNIHNLSAVFKDQIDKPLDRAVWWTEYVIRHKGAPKLRSAGRKLNFVQYHSLDVIALLLFAIVTVLYVSFKIIKLLCKMVLKLIGFEKKRKAE